MVSFLKGRRRTDDGVVAVDSSGAHITVALETLVARAEQAVEQLRSLTAVLERSEDLNTLRERCEVVEGKVVDMEGAQARIAAAEAQIERVAGADAEIDQLHGRLGEFGHKIDAALKLREQIEGFLSLEGPIGTVRTDAEGLRKQLDEMGEDVTRMRTQADDALRAHRHSTARLEHFNEEYQTVTGQLDEVARRVQTVERALEPVGQAVTAVPDLQHRLAVLKALADQVAQKSAALEQQREAVDRAATQISQLTRLDRELDAWLRRQEEQIRRFGQIEAKVAEVHAVQVKVMARSDELQQMAVQTEEAQQAARQSLNDLREQMRKSSESFELENRGLHAVSERVADLRNGVKECESRFAVLDAASQGTAAVTAQVRSAGEQAAELAAELGRLLEEEKQISSLRHEVGRLDGVASEVGARMQRIEELRPGIESAVKDLGSLKGTRELMADGLEQMRVAYEEMTRLRETHGEVETWLGNTDTWTRKVQAQVKELSGMEPAVERIREEVEQVKSAMGEIEARRETLGDVQRRLGDLGAVSAELKERVDALRGRMDAAESRFGQLAKQAEEAQMVADTMAEVTGSVSEAEKRMSSVDESVRTLEGRTGQLDELQDRIRLLGQDLDQRQGALDKATEHLTKASALRQEAADTAQRLEEVSRTVSVTLANAEERSGVLKKTTGDLESRAAALKPVERQLSEFEDLLGRWESAQAEAATGLEQTLARQGAVEALEAEVKNVFELAQRAVDNVQVIGSSRREIDETRALLEDTQSRFQVTEQALRDFEARKRALDRAEQRLARAEALALGIKTTVESLQAQKTVVDHAMESAGALGLQMKQAEALIQSLRRERSLAADLKAAVAALEDIEEEKDAE
jgi:chromosome segregation protein